MSQSENKLTDAQRQQNEDFYAAYQAHLEAIAREFYAYLEKAGSQQEQLLKRQLHEFGQQTLTIQRNLADSHELNDKAARQLYTLTQQTAEEARALLERFQTGIATLTHEYRSFLETSLTETAQKLTEHTEIQQGHLQAATHQTLETRNLLTQQLQQLGAEVQNHANTLLTTRQELIQALEALAQQATQLNAEQLRHLTADTQRLENTVNAALQPVQTALRRTETALADQHSQALALKTHHEQSAAHLARGIQALEAQLTATQARLQTQQLMLIGLLVLSIAGLAAMLLIPR
jgi:myosin heavy subunit